MKKLLSVISLILLAALAVSLSGCAGKYRSNDTTVIMKIGENEITTDLFAYLYLSYLKDDPELSSEKATEHALAEIRKICAVDDMCREYKVKLSSDDKAAVQAEFDDLRARFETDEEYYAELDSYNMAEQVYFDLVTHYKYFEVLYYTVTDEFKGDIPADDATVEKYIREHFLAAAQILISNNGDERTEEESEALANDIKAKIDSGEDFFALAKEYSEDEDSASYTDGYYFVPGMMLDFFEKEVKALEIGEIGDVYKSYLGYHIIYRLPLDEEYIGSHFESLRETYLAKIFNDRIDEKAASYTVEYTEAYDAFIEAHKK